MQPSAIAKPERFAVATTALVALLCATGWPSRLGLTPDEVGTILASLGTLAALARSAWQAWKAGQTHG